MRPINIVILGGGFGGLAAANELRENLTQDTRITIIDKKDWFMMDLVKLWIINGTRNFESSKRSLENVTKKGIEFVNEAVLKIDPTNKAVRTKYRQFHYDYLIIALGVELAPEQIPGLKENGFILYDINDVPKIRDTIRNMKSGKIVMAITGLPYKCPPAPFEAALLIRSVLEETGASDAVQMDFYSPTPITLPAGGPKVSEDILQILESKKIKFHGNHKTVSVEPNKIKFENGETNFDILISVPPHKIPSVVIESGFAEIGKFVSVDKTCKTNYDRVYAIGDVNQIMVTDKIAVPKAGIFAETEGITVARNIISQIKHELEHDKFDGKGGCFLETGKRIAGYIQVDMFATPDPLTELKSATPEHFAEKEKFEQDRLKKWL
ncbi:FAD-dependent pyridine nucleotide-disulphide oxidoreductase [Nitrosotalea sinensis]|uniref:FAD-dependent pyridine nucleotide-disulphide oxidoreductase n=1 Tax=Nitrosotalea sinensis TaxID=1499975 RepID=A0A2H1EG22_9ARCH|nr:FAD/NAD(P)-binding oxidoreductase [Candidatus Nitrosotalea sinensis]SHO43483.1 FAD-dependent pyridine nucleotide-disulphide oxidoreductase [Candidatus Nitrosotalea sinensis]